jgi:phosphate uptake regulator
MERAREEISTVQLTGGHSLSITLPKKWCNEQNIEKGDRLFKILQRNLLIITKKNRPNNLLFTIRVDNLEEKSFDYLEKVLIGAYVSGYDEIILQTNLHNFQPYVHEVVRWYTRRTQGSRITEVSNTQIKIVDNTPYENEIDKTDIQSMCVCAIGMLYDVRVALTLRDHDILIKNYDGVLERDEEIDKLHWLIHRNTSKALLHSITVPDLSFFIKMQNYIMSRSLERIGDHAVKMSAQIIALNNSSDYNINERSISAINTAILESEQILGVIIKAYLLTEDQKILRKTREAYKEIPRLNQLCDAAKDQINIEDKSKIPQLSSIIESIRSINEAIEEISIIINDAVIKESILGSIDNPNPPK